MIGSGFHRKGVTPAALLLLVAVALAYSRAPTLVAGAFFALNPVQTEVVYWISARGDSLALIFILAAMLAITEKNRLPIRIAMSGVLVLLALLSKETAIGMLPLVVAVPLVRPERHPSARRETVAAMVACAVAVAVWLLWRRQVGVFVPGDSGLTLGANLLVDFLTVLATLIGWCALPFNLSAAHDYAPGNAAILAAAAAGLPAAIALAVLGRGAEALDLLGAYLEWRPPAQTTGPPSLPADGRYHQVRALATDAAGRSRKEAAP